MCAAPVAVFAPAPRLSIHFEVPGEGGDRLHFHPGGQGTWVGRMATALGADVVVCGPFGGEAGVVIQALLADEGMAVCPVPTTQENGTSVHRGPEGEPASAIFSSPDPVLGRHELDALYTRTLDAALDAGTCVLTGTPDPETLPGGLLGRLAGDLTANGVVVVADLSGRQLRDAVDGGLSFVKASHADLGIEVGGEDWHRAVQPAARSLAVPGTDVLISCADLGAVAVLGGQGYRLDVPSLHVVNPRGAGDAMTGAVAAGLATGTDRLEAVQVAAAAGSLSVTRRGLATGDDRTIARLAERVSVRTLGPVDEAWG